MSQLKQRGLRRLLIGIVVLPAVDITGAGQGPKWSAVNPGVCSSFFCFLVLWQRLPLETDKNPTLNLRIGAFGDAITFIGRRNWAGASCLLFRNSHWMFFSLKVTGWNQDTEFFSISFLFLFDPILCSNIYHRWQIIFWYAEKVEACPLWSYLILHGFLNSYPIPK